MAVYLDPALYPAAADTIVFDGGRLRTPGRCKVEGFERKNDYDKKKGKGTRGATQTLKEQPPAEGSITFWAWTVAQRAAWTPILQRLAFDPSKNAGSAAATPAAKTPATPTSPASSTPTQSFEKQTQDNGDTDNNPVIPTPDNTTGTSGDDSADAATPAAKSDDPPALTAADAIEIFHWTLADLGISHVLPPESIGIWEEDPEGSAQYKRVIKFIEFSQPPAASIAATPTGSGDGADATGAPGAGTTEPSATAKGATDTAAAGSGAQGAWGAP